MAVSYACPPGVMSTWCPGGQAVVPSRPNIFNLPGMLAWTVVNWLMHALASAVTFISNTIVNYGFFSEINSPSYQFLYGLIRDIGFMILALMMLAAISFAVFPKANKQYSAAPLVRVMVSSCITLIMLVTRIPLVVMQLIFYTANKLTTTLLYAGIRGIPKSIMGAGAGAGMKVLVIGLLWREGSGFGFLYFLLLLGVLSIFIFGILVQVLGQIAGLVLALFLPLALATYNFDFGKKWTRALFEFTAVAAFAQVLSTIYLLFVFVLVMNTLTTSLNPLQILTTLGMAFLSVIPAKHLITSFASMMHSSAGTVMGHANTVHSQATAKFKSAAAGAAGAASGGLAGGLAAPGGGDPGDPGGGGGGGGGGTVAAGLLANHVNGATSSVTGSAGGSSAGSAGGSSGSGGGVATPDTAGVAAMSVHNQNEASSATTPIPLQTDGQFANAEAPNTDPLQEGGNPPPPVDTPVQKPKPSIAGVVSSARSAKDKIAQTQIGTLGTAAARSIQYPDNPLGAAMTTRAQFKARGQANRAKDKERLSHMLDRMTPSKSKPATPPPSTPPPPKD